MSNQMQLQYNPAVKKVKTKPIAASNTTRTKPMSKISSNNYTRNSDVES